MVVDQLLSQAAREHKDVRFTTLPELDRAARRLRAAVLVLLDPPSGGLDALWAAITARVSREDLEAASDSVGRLTPAELDGGGQDAAFRAELLRRYPSLRRFLPALLDVVSVSTTLVKAVFELAAKSSAPPFPLTLRGIDPNMVAPL